MGVLKSLKFPSLRDFFQANLLQQCSKSDVKLGECDRSHKSRETPTVSGRVHRTKQGLVLTYQEIASLHPDDGVISSVLY